MALLYTKIRGLEKCQEIYSVKKVIATEKIHGKNMRISIPAHVSDASQIKVGGRELMETDAGFDLGGEMQAIRKLVDFNRLVDTFKDSKLEITIFGEICGKGVQKGVNYFDTKGFLVFDIAFGEYLYEHSEMVEIASKLGLKTVPVLYEGEPTKEAFGGLINKESAIGRENGISDPKNVLEGVVLRSVPLMKNGFGEYIICKYKSAGFEEMISTPKEREKKENSAMALAERFVVRNRVLKMADKLKERGKLTKTMQDIRALGEETLKDIEVEEKGETGAFYAENVENSRAFASAVTSVCGKVYRGILEEESR